MTIVPSILVLGAAWWGGCGTEEAVGPGASSAGGGGGDGPFDDDDDDGAGGDASGPAGPGGGGGGGAGGGGAVECKELTAPDSGCTDATPGDCACVGCKVDGVCDTSDDCVCAECFDDEVCGTFCQHDGVCDPFIESCACADCVNAPTCATVPKDLGCAQACDHMSRLCGGQPACASICAKFEGTPIACNVEKQIYFACQKSAEKCNEVPCVPEETAFWQCACDIEPEHPGCK